MPNYWLHRIFHEWDVSKVLFEQGYLTIGSANLNNNDVLHAVRERKSEIETVIKAHE
ncbi:MAG: hypothetical protein GX909_05095 [Clostridiaceae bacterium]|nr:hypothetical protein [Clostridiaceae bacterium]